jgi:5-(carboxyamino)imidazole ribonucleotide mutase
MNGKAAILIGSDTDRETLEAARKYFEYFKIQMELKVMSAHRNPEEVSQFAQTARSNGYSVIIGAAGMAAHLAGALKAHTTLPVIGVPLSGGIQDGLDALFSTVQMPKGVPVATMAVGKAGAINAAILTAEILSLNNEYLVEWK